MCSLPSFTVVVPADAIEVAQVVKSAANTYGPFYIRLSRPDTPVVYQDGCCFIPGKAVTMKPGKDVTIIAIGIMVAKALEAAAGLAKEGIDCRVLNMPTIKPLDEEAILQAALETGALVTAEEHLEHGGLGSRVAQVVCRGQPVPMSFVAIKNTYAKSGKAEELLQRHGLTSGDIEQAVRTVIARKQNQL